MVKRKGHRGLFGKVSSRKKILLNCAFSLLKPSHSLTQEEKEALNLFLCLDFPYS